MHYTYNIDLKNQMHILQRNSQGSHFYQLSQQPNPNSSIKIVTNQLHMLVRVQYTCAYSPSRLIITTSTDEFIRPPINLIVYLWVMPVAHTTSPHCTPQHKMTRLTCLKTANNSSIAIALQMQCSAILGPYTFTTFKLLLILCQQQWN